MQTTLVKQFSLIPVQLLLGLIGTGIASTQVLAQSSPSPTNQQTICATNPANPQCNPYSMPTEGVRSTVQPSISTPSEVGGTPITPGSAAIQNPYSVPTSPISPYPYLPSAPVSPIISPVPTIIAPGIPSPVLRPW